MSHFSRCDLLKLVTIPVNFGLKKSLVPTFPWPFPRRKVFAGLVLKSAKLDKNIAKILLVGLKSAKYGQEYRDFGALKSAKIVQTLVGASRGLRSPQTLQLICQQASILDLDLVKLGIPSHDKDLAKLQQLMHLKC